MILMIFARNRSGSSTSDSQPLQGYCRADERREPRDASYVSCLTSSPLVSCLPSLQSPALARPYLSRALYLAPLTLLYYIVLFHPLFKSSLPMNLQLQSCPKFATIRAVMARIRLFYKGRVESCELKHRQGRSNPILAHLLCARVGESERTS